MTTRDSSSRQSRTPQLNDPTRAIPVLNPTVPMPEFSFFQIVKVRTTKEVGTVVGMWCVQTEGQSYQWLYRLEGLTERSTTWWQELQIRSLDRRQNR
ncbi:MAG: hypothetical protein HC936_03510 [Leptolyngbyaceae cyanobacterium SU_3_3]|nr:hypothetical protein [Leptolyngbyaceae cyanobacterium SU_3_3]NJR48157.1 hypothetical protein [Leptolyngbyaceae cyanobacterium CSU_1_3]